MEQVGRGQHVVERPVRRAVGEREHVGEGGEAQVGCVVAQHPAGEGEGVDHAGPDRGPLAGVEGRVEEGDVEPHVVADEDGAVGELGEGGEHRRRWAGCPAASRR